MINADRLLIYWQARALAAERLVDEIGALRHNNSNVGDNSETRSSTNQEGLPHNVDPIRKPAGWANGEKS